MHSAANLRALAQIAASVLPRVPTRGPWKSADVTATWLTEHLAKGVQGAAVLAVAPLDGTTGTTDRQRIVVEWNDAGKEAGLPANLFLKSSPLSAKNRVMVGALDMAVNEVHFYNEAAASLKGVVPKAWFAYAGIGARFLIVLEDIVADGGRPYALADRCEIAHARGVIEAFADLHSQFWNSPRFSRDLTWARTWSARPGYAVLKQFYSRGRAGALKLGRPEVTAAVRAVSQALDRHAAVYYREFEAGPLTLLHGDSHLGNTFSTSDGRSGLLDWQVVWQGPGLREVSYWMTTGLEPEMRRAHERELLERYLDALRSGGVPDVPQYGTAFERYRLFSAEAWDATAMTINWPGLQAEENAEAAWRRACVAVEDLDTASLLNRLR
ncbi:phosphotransferase [Mycolicibacterium sp. GESEQ-9]|uniref:phosphotransferase n=1 Tax=Mycolicibacterium sp. GESEQ-9 TaxID=2812656 RepID=UPI001B31F550|nr:phosphotransferase [Mycolicibacterium sp. GESEQ-9]